MEREQPCSPVQAGSLRSLFIHHFTLFSASCGGHSPMKSPSKRHDIFTQLSNHFFYNPAWMGQNFVKREM